MLLWLATALLDACIVGTLAWLVRGAERRHAAAVAASERRLARARRAIEELMDEVERRTRALDHALAMREATLRVLVQASAEPRDAATSLLDAADVRLLRDLELSLEPPAAGGAVPVAATR